MKNKIGKKLLVGAMCGCMMLSGGLILGGCSLRDKNNEIVVEHIEKTEAVDIIEIARQNFLMCNFENLETKRSVKTYEGYEDKLLEDYKSSVLYRFADGVKTTTVLEDDMVRSVMKSDFNNDKHYWWYTHNNEDVFDELEYQPGMWEMFTADIFSQSPFTNIGNIAEDHIVNAEKIDDGYKVDILTNLSTVDETDLSKYEDGDTIEIFYITMSLEIKNNCTMKASSKIVQLTVPVKNLITEMDGTNSTIELDDKGMPTISTYGYVDIITVKVEVEYKYKDIDFSQVDSKLAEIEEEYLTQE